MGNSRQKNLKVQVIYRNYIPLNPPYYSFWSYPPKGISFEIPKPREYLKYLFPIYRSLGGNPVISRLIRFGQRVLFTPKTQRLSGADLLFYVGMLPEKIPACPYIIDIEHAYSLLNFSKPAPGVKSRILEVLEHHNCKGIVPISRAAAKSLEEYLGEDFARIKNKVQVIYPALPEFRALFSDQIDYSIIPKDPSLFSLIFVGRDAYGKGLQELLTAFCDLAPKHPSLRLYVISEVPETLRRQHPSLSIRYVPPKLSYYEIMKKVFLPADCFVMPTHSDTFGMVYMEALASGIPVIATRQFATPEIVEDGVSGLLLNHPPLFLDRPGLPTRRWGSDFALDPEIQRMITEDLRAKIQSLVTDTRLYQNLKRSTTLPFKPEGRFSIETRNQLLSDLFRKALADR